MTLRKTVTALSARHGENHILPFIGAAFEHPETTSLRIAIVGINSYLSPKDWADDERTGWFADWWANAAHGKQNGETWPFYHRALEQSHRLAAGLLQKSKLFAKLAAQANLEASPPAHVYGTNAIKIYTGEEMKEAVNVPPDLIAEHAKTWHAELDAMAQHGAFPHLIVILGNDVWESAWSALHADSAPAYQHLELLDYVTAGEEDDPCFHHANRVHVRAGGHEQDTLLVRLHHPSAHAKVQKRAEWLLDQPSFRRLAAM